MWALCSLARWRNIEAVCFVETGDPKVGTLSFCGTRDQQISLTWFTNNVWVTGDSHGRRQSPMLAISSQTLFSLYVNNIHFLSKIFRRYIPYQFPLRICVLLPRRWLLGGAVSVFPPQSLSTCFLCSINPTRSDFGNFISFFYLKNAIRKKSFLWKTAKSELITGRAYINQCCRFRESLGLFFIVTETHAGSEEIKEKSRCRQPRSSIIRNPNVLIIFYLHFEVISNPPAVVLSGVRVEAFFLMLRRGSLALFFFACLASNFYRNNPQNELLSILSKCSLLLNPPKTPKNSFCSGAVSWALSKVRCKCNPEIYVLFCLSRAL